MSANSSFKNGQLGLYSTQVEEENKKLRADKELLTLELKNLRTAIISYKKLIIFLIQKQPD